jgi:hypothetical protein
MILAQSVIESTSIESLPMESLPMDFAPMAQPASPQSTGIAIFALLPMLLGLATWIFTIIIIWRAMKAHESIAKSLDTIAQNNLSAGDGAHLG